MEKIFDNPARLESLVKQKYSFPDFIMMENAALAMKNLIVQAAAPCATVLILCGSGNNGGDGYALARLLGNSFNIFLYKYAEPKAPEALKQYEICKKLKVPFLTEKKVLELLKTPSARLSPDNLIIADCLFGTGFHGTLPDSIQKIIHAANNTPAVRIACDISSGLAFNAHYTVTMGELKLALFGDRAKAVSGTIITADLGVDRQIFQEQLKPCALLVTNQDIKLPVRTDKAAHKGTYGHTAVFADAKAGAAVICATAAMNFGSGLTTLIKTEHSNLPQFKVSPELMISSLSIPAKTTCVVAGPGMDAASTKNILDMTAKWFCSAKNKAPAAVFDAGAFDNPDFPSILKQMDLCPGARIILTPHLLELERLCKNLKLLPSLKGGITVEKLVTEPGLKILIGQKINSLFPNTVLIIKSANTFIAAQGQTYIVADGCPSLAKGGSGDVLAGMTGALLAQGYSAKDAAITACQAHALAAQKKGASSYSLTPLKLIKALENLTFHP